MMNKNINNKTKIQFNDDNLVVLHYGLCVYNV